MNSLFYVQLSNFREQNQSVGTDDNHTLATEF